MCYLTDKHNQEMKAIKTESVEEFLARGGNVINVANTSSIKKSKKTKVNAQTLVNKASPEVMAEVIEFLKTQGIEVE